MIALYNDTITLFNRYSNREGDTWYPTVIRGVNVNVDRAAIIAKYGAQSADSVVLNIRYSFDGENKTIAGKAWKPPKEWGEQTNDELANALTFASGTAFDFFYIGEWSDSSPVTDDDFYNYMNDKYDDVYAITSVGLYTVIPHFEILGK